MIRFDYTSSYYKRLTGVVHYRPQRSCGKAMFSQPCVKNSVHRGVGWRCLPQCILGYTTPTPQADTPWADTPLGRQLPRQTPPSRHPPGRHPPGKHPLGYTPPGRSLQWTVRILLECIFVTTCFYREYVNKF